MWISYSDETAVCPIDHGTGSHSNVTVTKLVLYKLSIKWRVWDKLLDAPGSQPSRIMEIHHWRNTNDLFMSNVHGHFKHQDSGMTSKKCGCWIRLEAETERVMVMSLVSMPTRTGKKLVVLSLTYRVASLISFLFSFNHPFHSFIHSIIHLLTHSFIHLFIPSSFLHYSLHLFIHSFINLFIPLILSFIYLIHSLFTNKL